jgi:hypothetical protein
VFSLSLIQCGVFVLFGNVVFWHAVTYEYWFGWLVAGALQLFGIVAMVDHTADHFFREGFNTSWEEKRGKKR